MAEPERPNKALAGAILVPALALLQSACTLVGPTLEPLDPGGGEDWFLPIGPGIETAAAIPDRWWESFGDPVLNVFVDEARAQNLAVETAALRVLEARARLGLASGQRFPQTQIATGDSTFVSPSESDLLELLAIDDFWSYSLGATVAWEADFWGRYRRGIEAAGASLQAAVAAYDQAVILLTAQVVAAYIAVREAEEQLRIARINVDLQQRSYEITEVLFRNGESGELDMQQALALLLGTQATIPTLEAGLQQARNALSTLLGQAPGYVDSMLGAAAGIPRAQGDLAVGLPADMLRRRPDVLQAEYLAMAQSAVVGIATADLYPSFQLAGTLGTSAGGPGGTPFSDLFSSSSIAASLGGSFVWPFLNYERIRNNIRIEDSRLQQALVVYRDTVLGALRETEDAIGNYFGSVAQGRILEEAVLSASRSNVLSELRFREGFSDYQRVLDSQERLFAQQQRLVVNQAQTARDVVTIYKALGAGWQSESGLPPLDAATVETMRARTDWGELLDAYLE